MEELNTIDPSDYTNDGINEIADAFLNELEATIKKYEPWFQGNQYFELLKKDFEGISGKFKQTRGETI